MCERISRPIEDESRSDKKIMKKNVPIKKQPVEAKTQPPGIQRRINAGWLRLWRTVYPNTPPPTAPHPKAQGSGFKVRGSRAEVRGSRFEVQGSKLKSRQPAAVERLASFLSAWLALALLATGCAGTRPLKGGKAVTTHKPAGVIDQTLVQGENPSQATKQDQDTVKVRTFTLPAGSRIEQSQPPAASAAPPSTLSSQPSTFRPCPSTLNPQPPSS